MSTLFFLPEIIVNHQPISLKICSLITFVEWFRNFSENFTIEALRDAAAAAKLEGSM